MKDQLLAAANLQPGLHALSEYLTSRNISFGVVYLPDKTQVSDAYLPYYAQFGANKEPDSLMGLEYQGHARMLTRACSELGIPFLDLTKKITDQEARGCRLYWNYDSHLNAAGYQPCAQTIFDWWLPRHSENIR